MNAKQQIYYIDGEFVPADQAALPVHDLAITRGFGVFEALRTYGNDLFHLDEHIERLARSCALIDLELPWPRDEIIRVVMDAAAHNHAGAGDLTVRIFVTGGGVARFGWVISQTALVNGANHGGVLLVLVGEVLPGSSTLKTKPPGQTNQSRRFFRFQDVARPPRRSRPAQVSRAGTYRARRPSVGSGRAPSRRRATRGGAGRHR